MTSKPKLSVFKVVNKSLIAWNIKNDFKIPIYYKWDEKRLPKINKITGKFILPFIYVDYHPMKREWQVQYINESKVSCCTIDDITTMISISSFNY